MHCDPTEIPKKVPKTEALTEFLSKFRRSVIKAFTKQIQTGGEKGDPFTTYNLYLQNKPLPPTNKKNRFPLPGSPLKWKQSSSNHKLFRCYCGYMHVRGFKSLWASNGSSFSVNDALGGALLIPPLFWKDHEVDSTGEMQRACSKSMIGMNVLGMVFNLDQ